MEKKIPSKLDPFETPLLAMRREGLSYREMAAAMKARHRLRVSYRTIQNWFRTHHPELAGEDDDTDSAGVSITPGTVGGDAPASPPAEDLAALRAQLDTLARAQRALQDKNAALEAEIVSLTEQRPSLEVQPPSGFPLPLPYRGNWEHDMPMLPGEPIDITPASRRRVLRRVLTLGVIVVLLALCVLAFYTAFQDTLTRASLTARRAYVTVMHSHGPFALLEAALAISGLGLGLRGKALVPVGLALVTYLLMLRDAHIPFFIALMLTLQVSKALINGR